MKSEADLSVQVLSALAYSLPVRDAACLALCEILVQCYAGTVDLDHDAFDGLGITLTRFLSLRVARHIERRADDYEGEVRARLLEEFDSYRAAIAARSSAG